MTSIGHFHTYRAGITLQFDPEFSPPSAALSATRPDLYRAYNRPALSSMSKSVQVNILDSHGNVITTGPDSSIFLVISVRHLYVYDQSPTPQEARAGLACANLTHCALQTAIYNAMAAQNNLPMWDRTTYFLTHNATLQQLDYTNGITACASVPTADRSWHAGASAERRGCV